MFVCGIVDCHIYSAHAPVCFWLQIKNALLDITRAIHLSPTSNHLYMFRGELVRKLGDLELAAFCVRHAAELEDGLGQSPTQKAIVQSFLKNYDKV